MEEDNNNKSINNKNMSNGESVNSSIGISDVNVPYTFTHPMQTPGLSSEEQQQQQQIQYAQMLQMQQQQQQQYMQYMQQMQQMQMEMQMLQQQQQEMAAAAAAAAQMNLLPPFMQPSLYEPQPVPKSPQEMMQMPNSMFQPQSQPQPQSNVTMNDANWSSANNTSNGNVLQWLSQKAHVETASTLNKSDSNIDTTNKNKNSSGNTSSANIVPGVQSRGAIEYLLKQQQQQQANQKSSTSLRPATFSLSAMLRAADAAKQMESKERQEQLQQDENTKIANSNNVNDEAHKEVKTTEITERGQEGMKDEHVNDEMQNANSHDNNKENVITFTSTTSVVIQPDTNTLDLTKDNNNNNKSESEEESKEASSPNVLNLLAELLQRQASEAEVPHVSIPPPPPFPPSTTNINDNNVASSTDQMKQVEVTPQGQGQRYMPNRPHDLNRGIRGRRKPNNERNFKFHQIRQMQQLQQQQRAAEDEARKKHEEAMQNDPEYQRQFTSMQERMQSMQLAQMEFFNIYSRQEHVQLNQSITERLDMNMILDLIDKHDVVFICTDTGSGKSTNVPRALLELSHETRVVSTQPRRTATVAIASRVAQLRREMVGEDVGYWIRGEKKGDEQTRLWYMTSYTLLLRILEAQGSLPYTHIVLDEFHERQPDLEVTVALLRLALLHKTSHFKLILMSATLDTEDWVQYFTGLRVATYKQSEPEHPIYNYFMEDTCKLLGLDYTAPANLVQRVMVDKDTLDKHLYIAQTLIEFLNSCSHPHHAILVFLPGRAQVEHLQSWALAQLGPRVDVIPWHSAVDLSEIENAIRRRTPNRQKLYLATDIAEVSITIPDVVYVIDLVLVKRPKITQSVAASILYPPLVTQWISQGSIAQRRGRIGRVQQGFYFCLFPSDQIASLSPYAQPPIENSRIDELSLHCLQVVSNPVAIFSICHGQPLIETITSSMNTLTELGCIIPSESEDKNHENKEKENKELVPELAEARSERWSALVLRSAQEYVTKCIAQYECTFIGRILQLIPVSPQPGMLVFFGFLTGLESLMILAAAVTSSLSPFIVGSVSSNVSEAQKRMRRNFNVARAMEDTENTMRDLCCGLRSDIVAVMKATLLFEIEAAHSGANVQNVQQWCMQKNLSYEKLLAIVDLEQHIKFELANFVPFRDINDPTLLLSQLDKLAAMVAVMTNVAFVAQALEVTSESNLYSKTQEMALGLFSDLTAVPDIHSPSCLRWQEGDIIIPTQLNLFYDKLLASFSTAIASPKQFWMSLLLFTQHLHFATFSDDDGNFHVFELTYCGKRRFVELDDIAGIAVLEFRRRLSLICATLRLLHEHKLLDEETLLELLKQHGLKPLHEAQREVITMLVSIFTNLDGMTVDEVEHEEDDLDIVSALSFALPPLIGKAQE